MLQHSNDLECTGTGGRLDAHGAWRAREDQTSFGVI